MIETLMPMLAAESGDAAARGGELFFWALILPMASCLLCGLYWALGIRNKLPAWTTVLSLALSFAVILTGYISLGPGQTRIAHGFEWINVAFTSAGGEPASFVANVSLYVDGLTLLWMLFVTGLGALIALYASEYMAGDVGRGYSRFFFAFSLFVFAMTCLVMGDNLLFLFLGWEGVGLCSYLLIGYFFTKPSAVAAAKKAFIMNRIGDLGLSLGIMLTFVQFGSIEYEVIFRKVAELKASGEELPLSITGIPLLLMVGAFGKSAQLPLYTWLPDAMEGPTPVSALIHAATMVTAGVYLIARMYPVFLLNETALVWVAWIGGLTALLAATIGMAQFDIKRIMAYSTVSQLGYMFLGLGVLTTAGAAFHVFTHAFFKATLFLCCGAVMHGFAGQLDLRRLSGLWRLPGWKITTVAMLIGCLNLAGIAFTAGFFSKDMILAEAFVTPGYQVLGWIALLTAGLTAYYTFRVFFRVFVGPPEYEAGEEFHAHEHPAEGEALTEGDGQLGAHENGEPHEEHFHPHPPGWAINLVLVLLAIGSIAAAGAYFVDTEHHGWAGSLVHDSTAHYESPYGAHGDEAHDGERAEPGTFLGFDPHKAMYFASGVIGVLGVLIAAFLHGPKGIGGLFLGARTESEKSRADAIKERLRPVSRWAERKWYVDGLYDLLFRYPLWGIAHVFYLIDKLVVDGLVDLFGSLPRRIGRGVRPSQNGVLQSYAVGMAGGLVLLLLIVWILR